MVDSSHHRFGLPRLLLDARKERRISRGPAQPGRQSGLFARDHTIRRTHKCLQCSCQSAGTRPGHHCGRFEETLQVADRGGPEAKEKPKKIRYKKNKTNQVKRDSEFADAATSIRSGAELEDTVEYKPRLSTPRELASTASLESLSDSEPESSIVASEPSVLEFEPLKNAPPLRHLTSPKTPKEAKPPKKESVDRNAIVRINKNLPRFAELRTVELPEDLKQVASTVSSRWSLDRDAGQTNTLVGKQNENASLTETELPAVHLQRHDRTESQESNDRPRGGLAAIVAKKLASKTDPKP